MQLKEKKRERDFRSCFDKGRVNRAAVQWCQLRKRRKIGGGGGLGTTATASSITGTTNSGSMTPVTQGSPFRAMRFFLHSRISEIKRYFQLCIFNSKAFFFSLTRKILYGCYLLELVTSLEFRRNF